MEKEDNKLQKNTRTHFAQYYGIMKRRYPSVQKFLDWCAELLGCENWKDVYYIECFQNNSNDSLEAFFPKPDKIDKELIATEYAVDDPYLYIADEVYKIKYCGTVDCIAIVEDGNWQVVTNKKNTYLYQ